MSIPTTLAKSALFGALLLGNIAPPADNYYEDDGDFGSISASLQSGWGWLQVNAARAGDCDNNDTAREDCDGGGYEEIPVTGTPFPRPPWGGVGGDDTNTGSTDPGDQGGGSGGGPSEEPEVGDPEKRQECIAQRKVEEGVCKANAYTNFQVSFKTCNEILADPSESYGAFLDCRDDKQYYYDKDKKDCEDKLKDDVAWCEAHF